MKAYLLKEPAYCVMRNAYLSYADRRLQAALGRQV